MRIIPAIDMRGGSCVRLLKGDFERETRYSDDPAAVARDFAGLGLDDLHLVDLDGARSGEQHNRELVRTIVAMLADTSTDVQLGGGIRDRGTVSSWFAAGVKRVVTGSVAISDPDTVRGWLDEFGAERIVLALDCIRDDHGTPMLATHGWTRTAALTLWDCIDDYGAVNLGYVLCTDVSRDGAMSGPALDLYAQMRDRYPTLRIQASGGVRGIDDLRALRKLGIDAAITGRALLDGCIRREELESFRRDA